jgi:hypothetical protein
MGILITGGKFIADVSVTNAPAPILHWLEKELPKCNDLIEVANGIRDRLNEILKKDTDQYIFELMGREFRIFKNGKKVVEVKHD